jgi:hypothetical protein
MRRLGLNVKRLAWALAIWHRPGTATARIRSVKLAKDAEDKERIKAARLREALRANLRRRKAKPSATDKADDAPNAAGTKKDPPKAGL